MECQECDGKAGGQSWEDLSFGVLLFVFFFSSFTLGFPSVFLLRALEQEPHRISLSRPGGPKKRPTSI